MQRYIYLIIISNLFFVTTGCGLIEFPSKESSPSNHPVTQQTKSMDKQNTIPNEKKREKSKQTPTTIFDQANKEIITVLREDTIQKKVLANSNVPEKSITPSEKLYENDLNQPAPNEPKLEEESTETDEKFEEAKKKAAELHNTDQSISSDQGNVYEQPIESSTIVLQVLKSQNVHIKETSVDKDDTEIWCYVMGNTGQQDFNGWITYSIIESKQQPQ